jgi:HD-GYP domain-containing protein (c-di-GMP phosphodiesterase class II)
MGAKIPGYTSIRASTLVASRKLAMDLYLPVSGRPVRYAVGGQTLDAERLYRLKTYKQKKIWIHESQEETYRNYLNEILDEAEKNSKLKIEDRSEIVSSGAEVATEKILEKPEDKSTYLDGQSHFERFARFLQTCDGAVEHLLKLSQSSNDEHIVHSARVAALSSALGAKWNVLSHPKLRTALVTGAFLHDFDLERKGLTRRDPETLSPEEREQWKKHPSEGARLLGDKDYVDQNVIEIILQHEEFPNGTGFPKGLKGKEMNKLAVVVALVNRFELYTLRHPGDPKSGLKSMMVNELGRFDLAQLEDLKSEVTKLLGL